LLLFALYKKSQLTALSLVRVFIFLLHQVFDAYAAGVFLFQLGLYQSNWTRFQSGTSKTLPPGKLCREIKLALPPFSVFQMVILRQAIQRLALIDLVFLPESSETWQLSISWFYVTVQFSQSHKALTKTRYFRHL